MAGTRPPTKTGTTWTHSSGDPSPLAVLAEVRAIDRLIAGFPRHADQFNRPHEADAELLRLGPETFLATTIDGIANELSSGIYRDPFTAGWTLVHANLSDLAAVGAAPLGLMLALTLPPGEAGDGLRPRLKEGLDAALADAGVSVLGGDLNEGPTPHFTACALGLVQGTPITRLGIRPGDVLYASGKVGAGNALATVRLMGLPDALWPEDRYRPRARLALGQSWRLLARAMIDTSDGPLSALDHLARLNGVGLRLDFDLARWVLPSAYHPFREAGIPVWPLVCGEHGEYELIAAFDPGQEQAMMAAYPLAIRLGVATARPGIQLDLPEGRSVSYDGAFIRNLPSRTGDDWHAYVQEFQAFGAAMGLA